MTFHPAVLMLISWISAYAIFFILPFRLESRVLTPYGFLITAVFLTTFCAAALSAARPMQQRPRDPLVTVNFRRADQVMMIAAIIAIAALFMDMQNNNVFDLAASYAARSGRATDLLQGAQSNSSIWFQIGFLFYPVGYVYLAREIGFRLRPQIWRIAVFGLGPPTLAALAMGGRGPLFFAVVYAVLSYFLRQQVFPTPKRTRRKAGARPAIPAPAPAPARAAAPTAAYMGAPKPRKRRKVFRFGARSKVALGLFAGVAMVYFIQVFIARAEGGGGVEAALGDVGLNWGVSFNGHFSNLFYSILGSEGTYMVFVFAWYWVQGIVMSNEIFTGYDGPMLMGTYGLDLVSALMRRLNGDFVADGFATLLRMNVYGFVPSAFGSLYVDLKFFGLIPCAIWGYCAGLVYRNVKAGVDPRWLLLTPYISAGIVMSLNNTPVGLSNGLMLHVWLLTAFFLSKPHRLGSGTVARRRPLFAR
ncbi:oligosaccharide repeat unit polymerase [Brevundimonas sp. M20]|uniref:oligosaccharide repeat unit polymerase n=1 Tax=Brevundimonas sp. M20 TaxID=2591463 RepID=UPI00114793E6|nr:oligosaccharide repeat unit polymerase [Brevundimonas sp. M20]QDH72482.1 oligosaccharide repeat unit polymerase [Brevundimonas sp. M20]